MGVVVEQAKERMSQDATAIRMRTQNLIDKQSRLVDDTHARCEAALAVNHTRMRDTLLAYEESAQVTLRAYGEVLNQKLKTVMNSTITEDTLNQEIASRHLVKISPRLMINNARETKNYFYLNKICNDTNRKSKYNAKIVKNVINRYFVAKVVIHRCCFCL